MTGFSANRRLYGVQEMSKSRPVHRGKDMRLFLRTYRGKSVRAITVNCCMLNIQIRVGGRGAYALTEIWFFVVNVQVYG